MLDMSSQQGESCGSRRMRDGGVMADDPVMAVGNIEVWLQNLVDGMQSTVKSVIKHGARGR